MIFSAVWYGDCLESQPEIGNFPTDRLFTGQRYDDTGLYYYGARYYNPEIGRFISADTIIPDPMNPQAFNRYAYCLNNPLKYIDPSGHTVDFYIEDPNFDTLVQAWENFASLCPNQAEQMVNSKTSYTIVTNDGINDTYLYQSGTWGGDQRFNEKQYIYIGTESLDEGVERVAGTILHEVIGHIAEGNAGATQLEEYYAWNKASYIAQNSKGVSISKNPGGDGNNFKDWKSNLGLVYSNLNERTMTKTEINDEFAKQADYIGSAIQWYEGTKKYSGVYSYPSAQTISPAVDNYLYWWMYMLYY